jgi:protein-L-isoaspartate(D-aspartate) O-methyltransferase
MQDSDLFYMARRKMVDVQISARGIHDTRVLQAFLGVPRHLFIPRDLQPEAYEDHPLPIGFNQTISQPYIVALMTSLLRLEGNEKILEIGTGSGYQAAILSRLACSVHSVERITELAVSAKKCLEELDYKNVFIHVGDGSLGWPAEAPYDCILVTAGSPHVPEDLLDQLKIGGRLVIPVGERWRQMLEVWTKQNGKIEKEEILPVIFVPLKGKQGWQDSDGSDVNN